MQPASGQPDGSRRPIRIGGSILGRQRHMCAFFHSHDDEYRALLPFIKHGFECGEKAVHIIDPRRRDEHVGRLRDAGIDATAAQEAGQLDLRDWSKAHLRGGAFDQGRTLALIEDIRRRSQPARTCWQSLSWAGSTLWAIPATWSLAPT